MERKTSCYMTVINGFTEKYLSFFFGYKANKRNKKNKRN